MLVITGRIFSTFYINGVIGHFFDDGAVQIAVTFLGNDVINTCFPRIEIIIYRFHGIILLAFFHHRRTYHGTGGILYSTGVHGTVGRIIFHIFGFQFHIPIRYRNITIIIYLPVLSGHVIDGRIPPLGKNRCFQ